MPRPKKYSHEMELYIGRVCVRARRRRIHWKVLQRRFGVSRDWLWRRYLATLHAEEIAANEDVLKHLGAGHRRILHGYGGRNQAIG